MSDAKDSASAKPGEPKLWQPRASEQAESPKETAGNAAEVVGDERPKEYGGRDGLDPTRYGDWEKNGRCIDF